MIVQVRTSIVIGLLGVWTALLPGRVCAQEEIIREEASPVRSGAPDSTVTAVILAADSVVAAAPVPATAAAVEPFKPDPTRAVIYSAICPGLGQIYNRKYWKLPLVYGSFMGCVYAITWNNKNLKDYSQAYGDIMSDDPVKNNSWENFLPYNANPEDYIHNETFINQLKRRKDYYRRYRDLSIIITGLVYAICMIDAYVDAQLFDFDISPNLSMHVAPVVTPSSQFGSRSYGVSCSFNF